MPHNAAFHQGLHCLLHVRQNLFPENEMQYLFKKLYKMDHSNFIVCICVENYNGLKIKGDTMYMPA